MTKPLSAWLLLINLMENEVASYFILNRYNTTWDAVDETTTWDAFGQKQMKTTKTKSKAFGSGDSVSLPRRDDFEIRKKILLPLRLSYENLKKPEDQFGNIVPTDEISTDIDNPSNFSIYLDKNNDLYVLEKDASRIRRFSIPLYDRFGVNNTSNLVFDEYILDQKDIDSFGGKSVPNLDSENSQKIVYYGEPNQIKVGSKNIYLLDIYSIAVISKFSLNRSIKKSRLVFNDRIHIFEISGDEKTIFYIYERDKTKIYKSSLDLLDKPNNEREDNEIIDLYKYIVVDEPFAFSDESERNGVKSKNFYPYRSRDTKAEDKTNTHNTHDKFKDKSLLDSVDLTDINFRGRDNKGDNSRFIERFTNNIVDFTINNKLKMLHVITSTDFLTFDFDGNPLFTLDFSDKIREERLRRRNNENMNSQSITEKTDVNLDGEDQELNPTCVVNNEEINEVFIGNNSMNSLEVCFPFRINFEEYDFFSKNHKKKVGPKLEKLPYNGISNNIFLSNNKSKSFPLPTLFIINVIRSKNNNNTVNSSKEKSNAEQHFNRDIMSDKLQNGVENTYLELTILEKKSVYDVKTTKILESRYIDSLDETTRWNRITLDQDLLPRTFIHLEYASSNNKIKDSAAIPWIKAGINNNRVFLADIRGRYFKVKLSLSSLDQNVSPIFRKMKIGYSSTNYLQYLPEIYRKYQDSDQFLERFLMIFQTLFEDFDEKKNSILEYIDARITPNEFLPWLSKWLSLEFTDDWTEYSKRQFLINAYDIFKYRGTKIGLEKILCAYLKLSSPHAFRNKSNLQKNHNDLESLSNWIDKYFSIVDNRAEVTRLYRSYVKIVGNKVSRDTNALDENITKLLQYSFFILLNPLFVDKTQTKIISEIMNKEKPAHTFAVVWNLPRYLVLNQASYVGINSVIRPNDTFEVGSALLSYDTRLLNLDD